MLEISRSRQQSQFAGELQRYLCETLHVDLRVAAYMGRARLPAFLEHAYNLYECTLAHTPCIFMADEANTHSPSDIAKHVNIVRAAVETAVVAYAASSLSAHNRARLIKQRVPFVVPGNQLYMPDLAMDLREHFRASRSGGAEALSPVAQAVLFDHLLRKDGIPAHPSRIAARLHYSAMSVGRAFDDLVALELADTKTIGKMRHLRFRSSGRTLFEAAQRYLRNPARAVKYVKRGAIKPTQFLLAGESALSELTDLSRPRTPTYAIAASSWKAIASEGSMVVTDKDDAECVIETWSYDPAALSSTTTVDPLSLYAQFSHHKDERIAGAAAQLLEQVSWSLA